MQYKPAYMVVNNGQTKVFVGNYDNLGDLRSEYPAEYWVCWNEGDHLLVRLLSSAEFAERKRDERHRSSLFFISHGSPQGRHNNRHSADKEVTHHVEVQVCRNEEHPLRCSRR